MTEIQNEKEFKENISKGTSVVHFYTTWCQPCKDLDALCQKLIQGTSLKYLKIEAEGLSSISESQNITVVPTFQIFVDSKLQTSIEGANPQELVKQIQEFSKNSKVETLEDKLKRLIHLSPVVLFMKGSPDQPRCGFSAKIVQILKDNKVEFSHFDILSDQEVREGLKKFSNWPTFPQIYSNGKLIGGLDIVKELAEEGDLLESLGYSKPEPLEDKLKRLTNQSPIVLFIKGSPDQPRCGFSAKIVQILQDNKVQFTHFDILSDQEVREGLKKFSNWPTFPQLYSKGKLIGGLDIVKELVEEGELSSALQ